MRNKYIYGILTISILFILSIISCEKNDDITEQVQFIESSYFGICFSGFPQDLEKEVILMDNESYQEYFNQKRIAPLNLNCDTVELPIIDFNKYSLIGKYTEGGGCSVSYNRKVEDNNRNRITYTIKVEYEGLCEMLITSMNWALIPKLDESDEVEFIVK